MRQDYGVKQMAKSLKKQVESARIKLDKAINAIYSCAPNDTTKFWDCVKLASPEVVSTYETFRRLVDNLERQAVNEGKAYPASFGSIIWNR